MRCKNKVLEKIVKWSAVSKKFSLGVCDLQKVKNHWISLFSSQFIMCLQLTYNYTDLYFS